MQDRWLADNRCFGCGPLNPDGLQLRSYEDGDDLVATWRPDPRYAGPPGVVNGGVMAVPMDCHGTWAAMRAFTAAADGQVIAAVTAGYSVRLLAPTPVDAEVALRARVTGLDGRKAKVAVTAHVADELVATFDATFVAVGPAAG